jgi:putative hemolysin
MPILEISIVAVLIVLNGVFAMSELAIVSSKKVLLRKKAEQGSRAAKAALALADDTGRFLPTVQIGITLIGILAGAFSGATIAEHLVVYLEPLIGDKDSAEFAAVTLVVMVVTYATLIIGELVPKELALRKPEKFAMLIALPITWLAKWTSPLVWGMRKSCNAVLFLLGASDQHKPTVTQEEVKALIEEGSESGVFEINEKNMIVGVMRLADKPVRAFMVPRIDVEMLAVDAGLDDVLELLNTTCYSRFLVYEDDTDNILGILHTRDVLTMLLDKNDLNIRQMVKKVPVFSETSAAMGVMETLRISPSHIGIVVDEYGDLEGIITLADLIEAIAGELFQTEGEASEMTQREDGSWLVDGHVMVDKTFDIIGIPTEDAPEGDYHTMAGFILAHLRSLPQVGTVFTHNGFTFEVIDKDGHRIDKILISKQQSQNS